MKEIELGSAFQFIRNGMSVKQSKGASGLPITRIETISDGVVNPSKVGFAGLTRPDAARWLLQPGDILFSHINSYEQLGRIAVFRGDPSSLVHGMNLLCLRPDPRAIDYEYAKHLFRSKGFRLKLERFINKAVNQASVSIGNLSSIRVALPAIREQRRIATILDKAAELRAKRRAALALINQLPQAIFLDMFGDPATNERGWPIATLNEVAKTASGGTPDRNEDGFYGGHIPWVKSGELHQGEILRTEENLTELGLKKSSAKVMPPGTVLVAMYGATVGAVATLGISAATNQAVCCIQPSDSIVGAYLMTLLKHETRTLLAKRVGGAQPNLSQELIRSFKIPVPPIQLQLSFAERISTLRALKDRESESQARLESLFVALQNRAFAGEK